MRKNAKIVGILLMVVLMSSMAAALEKQGTAQTTAGSQAVIGSQDVITASDSGGGALSDRDILIIVLIVLAIIGLAAVRLSVRDVRDAKNRTVPFLSVVEGKPHLSKEGGVAGVAPQPL